MMLTRMGSGMWLVLVWGAAPLLAQAPLKLDALGPAAALVAEAMDKGDEIGKSLASQQAYDETVHVLKPSASLLAVIGQALAEHPDDSPLKKSGPSIRSASMVIARAKTYAEAHAAWPKLEAALKGTPAEGDAVEFDWAKITKMHPIMEEMSGRGAKFRRLLRRPKDPQEDSRHLLAISVAAISTYADTHEVKNPADLPQWREWATELHTQMAKAAEAVRNKETDKARDFFNAGMDTCMKCHEKFNQ